MPTYREVLQKYGYLDASDRPIVSSRFDQISGLAEIESAGRSVPDRRGLLGSIGAGLQAGGNRMRSSLLAGASMITGDDSLLRASEVIDARDQSTIAMDRELQEMSTWERMWRPRYIAYQLANSMPQAVATIGAGLATGGAGSALGLSGAAATGVSAGTAGLTTFGFESGRAYREAMTRHGDEDEAVAEALSIGLVYGVTEALPGGFAAHSVLPALRKSTTQAISSQLRGLSTREAARTALTNYMVGGATESIQEIGEATLIGMFEDDPDAFDEYAQTWPEIFFIGGLADVMFSSPGIVGQRLQRSQYLAVRDIKRELWRNRDSVTDNYARALALRSAATLTGDPNYINRLPPDSGLPVGPESPQPGGGGPLGSSTIETGSNVFSDQSVEGAPQDGVAYSEDPYIPESLLKDLNDTKYSRGAMEGWAKRTGINKTELGRINNRRSREVYLNELKSLVNDTVQGESTPLPKGVDPNSLPKADDLKEFFDDSKATGKSYGEPNSVSELDEPAPDKPVKPAAPGKPAAPAKQSGGTEGLISRVQTAFGRHDYYRGSEKGVVASRKKTVEVVSKAINDITLGDELVESSMKAMGEVGRGKEVYIEFSTGKPADLEARNKRLNEILNPFGFYVEPHDPNNPNQKRKGGGVRWEFRNLGVMKSGLEDVPVRDSRPQKPKIDIDKSPIEHLSDSIEQEEKVTTPPEPKPAPPPTPEAEMLQKDAELQQEMEKEVKNPLQRHKERLEQVLRDKFGIKNPSVTIIEPKKAGKYADIRKRLEKYGVRLFFYKGDKIPFNGLVDSRDPDVVYLREPPAGLGGSQRFWRTLGHELAHRYGVDMDQDLWKSPIVQKYAQDKLDRVRESMEIEKDPETKEAKSKYLSDLETNEATLKREAIALMMEEVVEKDPTLRKMLGQPENKSLLSWVLDGVGLGQVVNWARGESFQTKEINNVAKRLYREMNKKAQEHDKAKADAKSESKYPDRDAAKEVAQEIEEEVSQDEMREKYGKRMDAQEIQEEVAESQSEPESEPESDKPMTMLERMKARKGQNRARGVAAAVKRVTGLPPEKIPEHKKKLIKALKRILDRRVLMTLPAQPGSKVSALLDSAEAYEVPDDPDTNDIPLLQTESKFEEVAVRRGWQLPLPWIDISNRNTSDEEVQAYQKSIQDLAQSFMSAADSDQLHDDLMHFLQALSDGQIQDLYERSRSDHDKWEKTVSTTMEGSVEGMSRAGEATSTGLADRRKEAKGSKMGRGFMVQGIVNAYDAINAYNRIKGDPLNVLDFPGAENIHTPGEMLAWMNILQEEMTPAEGRGAGGKLKYAPYMAADAIEEHLGASRNTPVKNWHKKLRKVYSSYLTNAEKEMGRSDPEKLFSWMKGEFRSLLGLDKSDSVAGAMVVPFSDPRGPAEKNLKSQEDTLAKKKSPLAEVVRKRREKLGGFMERVPRIPENSRLVDLSHEQMQYIAHSWGFDPDLGNPTTKQLRLELARIIVYSSLITAKVYNLHGGQPDSAPKKKSIKRSKEQKTERQHYEEVADKYRRTMEGDYAFAKSQMDAAKNFWKGKSGEEAMEDTLSREALFDMMRVYNENNRVDQIEHAARLKRIKESVGRIAPILETIDKATMPHERITVDRGDNFGLPTKAERQKFEEVAPNVDLMIELLEEAGAELTDSDKKLLKKELTKKANYQLAEFVQVFLHDYILLEANRRWPDIDIRSVRAFRPPTDLEGVSDEEVLDNYLYRFEIGKQAASEAALERRARIIEKVVGHNISEPIPWTERTTGPFAPGPITPARPVPGDPFKPTYEPVTVKDKSLAYDVTKDTVFNEDVKEIASKFNIDFLSPGELFLSGWVTKTESDGTPQIDMARAERDVREYLEKKRAHDIKKKEVEDARKELKSFKEGTKEHKKAEEEARILNQEEQDAGSQVSEVLQSQQEKINDSDEENTYDVMAMVEAADGFNAMDLLNPSRMVDLAIDWMGEKGLKGDKRSPAAAASPWLRKMKSHFHRSGIMHSHKQYGGPQLADVVDRKGRIQRGINSTMARLGMNLRKYTGENLSEEQSKLWAEILSDQRQGAHLVPKPSAAQMKILKLKDEDWGAVENIVLQSRRRINAMSDDAWQYVTRIMDNLRAHALERKELGSLDPESLKTIMDYGKQLSELRDKIGVDTAHRPQLYVTRSYEINNTPMRGSKAITKYLVRKRGVLNNRVLPRRLRDALSDDVSRTDREHLFNVESVNFTEEWNKWIAQTIDETNWLRATMYEVGDGSRFLTEWGAKHGIDRFWERPSNLPDDLDSLPDGRILKLAKEAGIVVPNKSWNANFLRKVLKGETKVFLTDKQMIDKIMSNDKTRSYKLTPEQADAHLQSVIAMGPGKSFSRGQKEAGSSGDFSRLSADIRSLLELEDVPEYMMDAWGRKWDPVELMSDTTMRIGSLVAGARIQKSLLDLNEEMGFMSFEPKDGWVLAKSAGQLEDTLDVALLTGFRDVWVPHVDFINYFRNGFEQFKGNIVWDALYSISYWMKSVNTKWNIPTGQTRNLFGSLSMAAAWGDIYAMNPTGEIFTKARKHWAASLRTFDSSKPEDAKLRAQVFDGVDGFEIEGVKIGSWLDMVEMGLMESNVQMEILESIERHPSQLLEQMPEFMKSVFGRLPTEKAKELRTTLDYTAGEAYAFGDQFVKLVSYMNNIKRLKKIGWSNDHQAIREEAARRTKNTYHNYSMLPAAVRQISKFPLFGSFVAFPSEMVRVTAMGLSDIKADITSGNPELVKWGYQRLGSFAAHAIALPMAISAASAAFIGMSGEEKDDMREFMPEWDQNGNHLWFNIGGRRGYANMSNTLAFETLWSWVRAARNEDGNLGDKLRAGFMEMVQPYIDEDLGFELALAIGQNRRAGSNRPIYNPDAGMFQNIADVSAYVADVAAGGGWRNIKRMGLPLLNAAAGGEARHVTDTGNTYDLTMESIAITTSFRANVPDVERNFGFKLSNYRRRIGEAEKLFHRQLTSPGSAVDEGSLRNRRRRSEGIRERLFVELAEDAQRAMRLGVPYHVVYEELKSSFSTQTANDVLAGIYRPYIPSPHYFRRAVEAGGPDRASAGWSVIWEIEDGGRVEAAGE